MESGCVAPFWWENFVWKSCFFQFAPFWRHRNVWKSFFNATFGFLFLTPLVSVLLLYFSLFVNGVETVSRPSGQVLGNIFLWQAENFWNGILAEFLGLYFLGLINSLDRGWGRAGAALPERSGSSTKGRTPNILMWSCFRRALNESLPSLGELSAEVILLL